MNEKYGIPIRLYVEHIKLTVFKTVFSYFFFHKWDQVFNKVYKMFCKGLSINLKSLPLP